MKRHSALINLSREHHNALILARLLRKNAPVFKNLPSEIIEKSDYAEQYYMSTLLNHFEAEERVLLPYLEKVNSEIDIYLIQMMEQHIQLRKQFNEIKRTTNLIEHLDKIGENLENHIRMEERQLFEAIQSFFSETELKKINTLLSN